MRVYKLFFVIMTFVSSFSCFGQGVNQTLVPLVAESVNSLPANKSTDGRVVDYYHVEEIINMGFGKSVTIYNVSRLEMVDTRDLGANNKRIVTPVYRKVKTNRTRAGVPPKAIVDTLVAGGNSVKIDDVTILSENGKSVSIDVVSTYVKVLDKGYKSVDMLKKVADRFYFDGNLVKAVKYYSQLFEMDIILDTVYYYRYAQSLKGVNEIDKANEMMKLFESKNL